MEPERAEAVSGGRLDALDEAPDVSITLDDSPAVGPESDELAARPLFPGLWGVGLHQRHDLLLANEARTGLGHPREHAAGARGWLG